MTVVFFTEGGKARGFGHLTRCMALAQALESAFAEPRIRFIVNKSCPLSGLTAGSRLETLRCDWTRLEGRARKAAAEVDLVIVDSYKAPADFYRSLYALKRERRGKAPRPPFIAVLDDFNRLAYAADMVINPGLSAVRYRRRKGVRFLLGHRYCLLRKEFAGIRPNPVRNKVARVLVTLGGGDHRRFIRRMMPFLLRQFPGVTWQIVTRFKDFRLAGGNMKFHVSLPARRMKELMFCCDIALSGGGQTLNECCRAGVPVIAFSFSENQTIYSEGFVRDGLVLSAGDARGKDVMPRLIALLSGLLDRKKRKALAVRARRRIDGKGSMRIARELKVAQKTSLQ